MSTVSCQLPTSNQVGGPWAYITGVNKEGCPVYLTCADIADCLPDTPESPSWDGSSPDNSVSITNDGAGSPNLGHTPDITVNIAGGATCPDNAIGLVTDGLCVPRGANALTTGFITGTGTTSDPIRLDNCSFASVPNGTSVTHLGISITGCLVQDTIPSFNETEWIGLSGDDAINIANGGTVGHGPSFSLNIADDTDCPNNILSIQSSGLCAHETPLVVTSNDGSVSFTQSGTSDHELDLSVSFTETEWTGTPIDSSLTITSGGTAGHAPMIGVNIAGNTDCPDNTLSVTPEGLCVQETPLTVTSNDGSVVFAQSGTANHVIDLSVSHPTNTPLVVTSPDGTISFSQSGTDDHALELGVDICNLGIQAGTAVSFVGVSADGCLVTDTVSSPAETPWSGTSSNAALTVTGGGTNGHGPSFAVNIASVANCPDNLISIAADGLCVSPLPLTVGSSNSTVNVTQSGTAGYDIDLTVPSFIETTWNGGGSNDITVTNGGTNGHGPTFAVNIASGGDCADNLLTSTASGLCVQETPLVVTSNDGSVVFTQSGTANHTLDLSVPAGAETALVLSSPNGTITLTQSGTAAHTATLDIDWCNAGIPNGTVANGIVLGEAATGCIVRQQAGWFAQSSGSNTFIPLGSNYDVAIDYNGINGTTINGQPVFDGDTNTLHFPLMADDDYRRIGDTGPTYKSFTEADQAWRTGDVVWGDSVIQADTKGDFRGNLNVGIATNIVTAGQFTLSHGQGNVNSGLYTHTRGRNNTAIGLYSFAGGDGSIASGAVAAFALGVVETAGGGWAGPTQATGDGGFAVGRGAQANNEWSVAMGRAVQANGEIATGFGSFIRLDGNLSGAIGRAQTTTANGVAGFLGGGFDNTVDTLGAAIVGSANGLVTGNANFSLLHGNNNTINNGGSSFISGDGNTIDCFGTSFAQGRANNIVNPNGNTEASGVFGRENTASGEQNFAFGRDNITDGFHCFVHGQNNTGLGNRVFISGQDNFANNIDVGAIIGSNNTLNAGVIDGYVIGEGNTLDAQNTVGIGKDTNVTHAGSVLISATTNAFPVFNSTATEQFAVRAAGGVRITTNGTATSGSFLNAGGSFWGAISVRESKDNIEKVDNSFGALDRVLDLPLYLFRYKDEDKEVRNFGPMADEWERAIRGTGLENKTTTIAIAKGNDHKDRPHRKSAVPDHSEKQRSRPSHGDGGRRERANYSQHELDDVDRRQHSYDQKEVVTISPNDMSALALAAIQEMATRIEGLEAKLSACCDDKEPTIKDRDNKDRDDKERESNGKKKRTNRQR